VKRAALLFFILMALPLTAQADTFADHFQTAAAARKVPPLVFEDQNSTQHTLSDYRGHYILLNIWATWCGPCAQEMPSLDALQTHIDPAKLVVLPVSEDHGDAIVTSFYQTHGIKYLPVAIDHAGIATTSFNLQGLPTTLLIDPQGNEVGRVEGNADWSSPEVINFLTARMR
jgi:thiol-disulfide isomerase/thioredoxin